MPRRALWRRLVEPYLSKHSHPFAARTTYGPKVSGNQRWIMHRCIYYFGIWEPLLTRWIHSTLEPGDTFVDVGANIGYFSLLASSFVGPSGSVVAIEPSPMTFVKLQENIHLNRFHNIRTVQAAAAGMESRIPFYRASNDAESSTVAVPGSIYEGDVSAAPLAELLSERELARTRLIKIDVEGAELDVVTGLVPAVQRLRPDAEIVVEVHPHLLPLGGGSHDVLIDVLEGEGFITYYLPVDFSTLAHLEPSSSLRPVRLTAPNDELVHLIFSRRRSGEL
jgi:FkbM family methyltransferase